jgi:hypothetical protein
VAFLFYWQAGQTPKNSNRCVTALNLLWVATRSSNSYHAVANLDHGRASGANQMMLVAMMTLVQQRKPRHAITKMKSLYHLETLQQSDRAINCGKVARAIRQPTKDFLTRHRPGLLLKRSQDRPAWASHFAGFPAQTFM